MLPRLAEGGTVVCLASGPSLTAADVAYVRGRAVVIAVNDAVKLAPWADVIYSSDQNWWSSHYREMRALPGIKVRVDPSQATPLTGRGPKYCAGCRRRKVNERPCWCEGIVTLKNGGAEGLSLEPDTICTYLNSGGAAINLAVQVGARRIVLLGYDMGPDSHGRRHFYDTDATTVSSPFLRFRQLIATMVPLLKTAGIEVVNCSRQTRLECFPCRPLREVFEVAA